MDIRSIFAAQKYAATRAATAATPQPDGMAASVGETINSFQQALQMTDRTSQDALAGTADPHALVHALAQSELAVEAAVTVRNKVVEAYQEILRMPI